MTTNKLHKSFLLKFVSVSIFLSARKGSEVSPRPQVNRTVRTVIVTRLKRERKMIRIDGDNDGDGQKNDDGEEE